MLAINGRTWPWTERIETSVGDTARWRFINATIRGHPMHMHGFCFRVDAEGTTSADTAFPTSRRQLVVTRQMTQFSTMRIAWAAPTSGTWLFHCHITFHITPENALDWPAHTGGMAEHMVGLVMGITVRPRVVTLARSSSYTRIPGAHVRLRGAGIAVTVSVSW